jgi:hypothetical protein
MSIFVSVASYCDPMLGFTLERAASTAKHPEALHFGVVDQSPTVAKPSLRWPRRVSYLRIDPVDARGPCWARALAMTLYAGESWFLQLDSHMDFDTHWDVRLIDQARALLPGRTGVVLASYPNPFTLENGQPVHKVVGDRVLAHVVKPNTGFDPGHLVLTFEAHPVPVEEPLPGFHLAAGCLFAPGRFAVEFPYDPRLYFHGEEQALTLRLYTHGWDIFHPPGLPLYHLYNVGEAAGKRPMHWDPAEDARRAVRWSEREKLSRQRLGDLVAGAPLGVYGLGRARTLADYAALSGIDYARKSLGPQAYKPLAPVAQITEER